MTVPPVSNELTNSLLDQIVSFVPAAQGGRPSAVILMGGVAAGKTTIRKRDYSHGYVLIDSADVFLRLCQGRNLDFPGELQIPMEYIGGLVAFKALNEKRPVVTEIIGDNKEATIALIEALKSVNYDVKVVAVTCEVDEAMRRNALRGDDNISAYYAGQFQTQWITHACQVLNSMQN